MTDGVRNVPAPRAAGVLAILAVALAPACSWTFSHALPARHRDRGCVAVDHELVSFDRLAAIELAVLSGFVLVPQVRPGDPPSSRAVLAGGAVAASVLFLLSADDVDRHAEACMAPIPNVHEESSR